MDKSLVTKQGEAKIFYQADYEPIPMDADDDRPSAPSKSLAQIAENQCLTTDEIAEYAERQIHEGF